jgi:hypothetical protein
MFIYKFNCFTKKYYKYDKEKIDLFSPMFDEKLHDDNLIHIKLDNNSIPVKLDKHICMYCNTQFDSRNKLYHHLGFMNINTTNTTNINSLMIINNDHENIADNDYESDMGEYGYELKKKKNKKQGKKKYCLIKKKIKKEKNINNIISMFNAKLIIEK